MVQVSLMTVRKAGGSITMEQMSKIYELVVNYYKQIGNVDGDGYYVVSALAYFLPHDRRLIDDFWKYIDFGLQKYNQPEVFHGAISCICDFASTYRDMLGDKVDSIFNQLYDLFEVLISYSAKQGFKGTEAGHPDVLWRTVLAMW